MILPHFHFAGRGRPWVEDHIASYLRLMAVHDRRSGNGAESTGNGIWCIWQIANVAFEHYPIPSSRKVLFASSSTDLNSSMGGALCDHTLYMIDLTGFTARSF